MSSTRLLILGLALQLAAPIAAVAQTPGKPAFPVQGTVLDWKASPVDGAIVRLESPDRTYQVKTVKDGGFTFPAIVPGKYHGRVVADGFPPFDQDVDLSAPPARPGARPPRGPRR